jgi:calcineurin-like phosphoesterase family protein
VIYFTSDIHFGHYLPALNRPFTGQAMDEYIIDRWNSTVSNKDEVWVLGDFSLHSTAEQMQKWFERLNGSKHLILGNHDKPNKVHRLRWASIHDTHMLTNVEIGNCRDSYWLSHYSHRVWPSKHHGVYHLYGHSHGHLAGLDRSMDVGIDANEYKPIAAIQVHAKLSHVEFEGKY